MQKANSWGLVLWPAVVTLAWVAIGARSRRPAEA